MGTYSDYRINKPVIFIFIAIAIVSLNADNIIAALHHRYYVYEQDAYMHMVIAWDVLQHHDWYEHVNYRINAPFGSDTHGWTQPITALLVGGTLLLHSLTNVSMANALYVWSFILPMLCEVFAAYAMLWASNIVKPTLYQQMFIVSALLLNPFISPLFSPLRVDYDFLLILVSIFFWGCLLRLIVSHKKKWVFPTAIFAVLGSWTSISFVMLVLISIVYLAWLSVVKNQLDVSKIKSFLFIVMVGLTVAVMFEHRHFFTATHDVLSVVHLTFFLLLLLGVTLYEPCLTLEKKSIKLIVAIILMVLLFCIMNYLFPGFYRGPYNEVDPYLLQNFFTGISEFHSPFWVGNAFALALLFYFLIGLGFFYYLYLDNKLNAQLGFLLWIALIMTFLAIYMYRWNEFSGPINIMVVSFFVASCCTIVSNHFTKIGVVVAMVMMPRLILTLAGNDTSPAHQQCQQQFYTLLNDNYLEQSQFARDKILLAHSNYGPLILYSTHYSIIATNDHHNPDGVKDSLNFFKGTEANARQLVMKRKIDLILVCKAKHPIHFDMNKSSWLQNLPLPKKYSSWELYRSVPPTVD